VRRLVFLGPGELEWHEVPAPRLEDPGDALVRPVVATICDLDSMTLTGRAPFGGPLALGHECVAEVVEVGEEVRAFEPGSLVVVPWHVSCFRCDRCRRGVPTSCRETGVGAMYGLPISGDWGSMFSDLVRVPYADRALVALPPTVSPTSAVSASDNLPLAWEVTVPKLRDAADASVLVMGGCGSIGLYAVACALAGGAGLVDYRDTDPDRLAIAEGLGARPSEGPPPRRMDRGYLVTVDATNHDPDGLACALRSVEPEGFCSTVGLYFGDVELPLFDMFGLGVNFHIGKGNARPAIPHVLELVAEGRLSPQRVTTGVFDWEELPDVLAAPPMKPVFVR
jgi:threonine dehydrogenase-like Zn-dependent dehydrogenase